MIRKGNQKLIIYTDGGSRGNPGPSAFGVVIQDENGRVIREYGEYLGDRHTNNEAEYQAVISALKKLKQMLGKKNLKEIPIEFRTDSELLVNQLNGKYKVEGETIIPLFIKIWNLKIDFGPLVFIHVPRGKNQEADRLVNSALDARQSKLF